MLDQYEQLKAQIEEEDTFIDAISVKSSSEFGWGMDAAAIGQIVIAVSLASFAETIAGKLAEDGWDLLKRTIKALVRRLRPKKSRKTEPVSVLYRSQIDGIPLDVLLQYHDYSGLARDVKNHRQYLSLAYGFASARAASVDSSVSLLFLLKAQGQEKPREFTLRPKSAE